MRDQRGGDGGSNPPCKASFGIFVTLLAIRGLARRYMPLRLIGRHPIRPRRVSASG